MDIGNLLLHCSFILELSALVCLGSIPEQRKDDELSAETKAGRKKEECMGNGSL